MDGNPHVDEVKALIVAAAAGTEVEDKVFDGKAPNLTEPPWISLYADPAVRSPVTLDGDPFHLSQSILIHGVGGNRRAAGWAADLALAAVVGKTIVVDGRRSWQIRQEYAQPARQDVNDPDLWLAVGAIRIRND